MYLCRILFFQTFLLTQKVCIFVAFTFQQNVTSYCSACFVLFVCVCTGRFVMVPFNLTCQYCLQHISFEHILILYYNYIDCFQITIVTRYLPILHLTCYIAHELAIDNIDK